MHRFLLVPAAVVLALSAVACSSSSSDARNGDRGSDVQWVDPKTSPATPVPVTSTTAAVPTTAVPDRTTPGSAPSDDAPGWARRTAAGIEISEVDPAVAAESARAVGAAYAGSRVAIDVPGDWAPPERGADILVWVGDGKISLLVFEAGPEVAIVRAALDGQTMDESAPVDGLGPLAIEGDSDRAIYTAYRADGTEVTTCRSDAELPALLTCT